ncbi:MAG: hypothetical protein JWN80_1261 [Microbacteriaceae bacterium]|nr:hypothetical protein [Microbacteriaceae bacterium]
MKSNIAKVTVDGVEVSRYFDLDPVSEFAAETDEGHHYVVRRITPDGKKPRAWSVSELAEDGAETLRGMVNLYWGSGAYSYTEDGEYIQAGSQSDLWNASQGLTT